MILLMVVFLWALFNVVVFTAMDIAILVMNLKPCTKSWLFSCVTLTDEAAAEVGFLLCAELLCSAATAAALPAPLRSPLAAAVHALAWVALATTVGMHCMKVASDRIVLAAEPGNTVHVAFGYICLAVDLLLAGVLLISCSRRRL